MICNKCIRKVKKLPWSKEKPKRQFVCTVCLPVDDVVSDTPSVMDSEASGHDEDGWVRANGGGVSAVALYSVLNFPTTGKDEYVRLLDVAVAYQQLEVVRWLVATKSADIGYFFKKSSDHYQLNNSVNASSGNRKNVSASSNVYVLKSSSCDCGPQSLSDIRRPILQAFSLQSFDIADYFLSLLPQDTSSRKIVHCHDAAFEEIVNTLVSTRNIQFIKSLFDNCFFCPDVNESFASVKGIRIRGVEDVKPQSFAFEALRCIIIALGDDADATSFITTVLNCLKATGIGIDTPHQFSQLPTEGQKWFLQHSTHPNVRINIPVLLIASIIEKNEGVLEVLLTYRSEEGQLLDIDYDMQFTVDGEDVLTKGRTILHQTSRSGPSWVSRVFLLFAV